jgi:hypothetical protein
MDMMKARGVVCVPTLMTFQGFRERLQSGNNLPAPIAAKGRAARGQELWPFNESAI